MKKSEAFFKRDGRFRPLWAAICAGLAWEAAAQQFDEEVNGIVSEKDSVALVEDSSVGESIGRRPDLSFANVTIDGEDSRVSLDSISADAVESVEVLKAVTPDQDADSRGGSISLKSRPAYQQNGLATRLSLETEYQSFIEDFGYEGQLNLSGPLNEKRTVGGRLSVRWEENRYGNQFADQNWAKREVDGDEAIILKETRLFDQRSGGREEEIGGSIDFKASEALSFFIRGNLLEEGRKGVYPSRVYRFGKGAFVYADETGGRVTGAQVESGLRADRSRVEEMEGAVGADWQIGDWELDAKYTMQDSSFTQLEFQSADFVAKGVDLEYGLSDPRFPEILSTNTDLSDADLYVFEDLVELDRDDEESDKIASLNGKWKYPFGRENVYLRFGMKSRVRDQLRNFEYAYYGSDFGADQFMVSDVLGEGTELSEGRYALEPVADPDRMGAYFDLHRGSLAYQERRSRERSDYASYGVEERVDAVYGMASVELGKWRGLFGLRQEATSISFNSNEVLLEKDSTDRDGDGNFDEIVYVGTNETYGANSYGNVFPNAHMRYLWGDRTTVIASYTNTIDRPRYSEVVPYRRVDLENREIGEGNPELKPTLYRNLDMSLDMKLGERSLLSLELFDRAVEDVIFARDSIVSGGLYDGYELRRQENNAAAQIRGMSLTWNQPIYLAYLPGDLSWNAKYTQQETEVVYPFRHGEVLPVTGSPGSRVRLALNYETKKLFAQLRLARSDSYLDRVNTDPDFDRYRVPSDQMDLMVSYKLQSKTRVYVEWDNLINSPANVSYEGEPYRLSSYRESPWSIATGVKMEL